MNIFKQFLYRHCLGQEHLIQLDNKVSSKIGTHDEYDEYLANEISNISQIDFINGILEEIDILFKKINSDRISFSNGAGSKYGIIKCAIFDTYLVAFVDKIESLNVKNKLEYIIDDLIVKDISLNKLDINNMKLAIEK